MGNFVNPEMAKSDAENKPDFIPASPEDESAEPNTTETAPVASSSAPVNPEHDKPQVTNEQKAAIDEELGKALSNARENLLNRFDGNGEKLKAGAQAAGNAGVEKAKEQIAATVKKVNIGNVIWKMVTGLFSFKWLKTLVGRVLGF